MESGQEVSKEYVNLLKSKIPETLDDWIENPAESVLLLTALRNEFLLEFKGTEEEKVQLEETANNIDKICLELRQSKPSKEVLYNLVTLELMMLMQQLDTFVGRIEMGEGADTGLQL